MSRFKEYQQNQILLMLPSLEEKMLEDHLARYISRVANEPDIHEITELLPNQGNKSPKTIWGNL